MASRLPILGGCVALSLAGVALVPTTHALPKRPKLGEIQPGQAKPVPPPPEPTRLVRIPGGVLEVDTSRYIADREFPPSRIGTFSIEEHEVTAAQYRHCVKVGKCTAPRSGEPLRTFNDPARQDHPINFVSREQARAYCAFVGRRLPTRWEWEWAAQGRDEARRFPWGSQPPERDELSTFACANRGPVSAGKGTCPVMSVGKDRTRDGVFDMGGNVMEIVDTNISVRGSLSFVYRAKGGNWLSDTSTPMRVAMDPAFDLNSTVGAFGNRDSINSMGFRCAETLVPPTQTTLPVLRVLE